MTLEDVRSPREMVAKILNHWWRLIFVKGHRVEQNRAQPRK